MNAKSSYWDMDSCAWVAYDPTVLAAPVRPAQHTHDRALGELAGVPVPEQRDERSGLLPVT